MEKLELKHQDAANALKTLQGILNEPYSLIVRDATIQRFEYTFEALWKFIQAYLNEKEGIIAGSPKAVFRELLPLSLLNEDEVAECLEMTDSRNDTVHTYKETVAQMIFSRIPHYAALIQKLMKKF